MTLRSNFISYILVGILSLLLILYVISRIYIICQDHYRNKKSNHDIHNSEIVPLIMSSQTKKENTDQLSENNLENNRKVKFNTKNNIIIQL
jgi:hypothetical protein